MMLAITKVKYGLPIVYKVNKNAHVLVLAISKTIKQKTNYNIYIYFQSKPSMNL